MARDDFIDKLAKQTQNPQQPTLIQEFQKTVLPTTLQPVIDEMEIEKPEPINFGSDEQSNDNVRIEGPSYDGKYT